MLKLCLTLTLTLLLSLLSLAWADPSSPPDAPEGWRVMSTNYSCRTPEGQAGNSETVCGVSKSGCEFQACAQLCVEREGCEGVEYTFDGVEKGTCKLQLEKVAETTETSESGVACYAPVISDSAGAVTAGAGWRVYVGFCRTWSNGVPGHYASDSTYDDSYCRNVCRKSRKCRAVTIYYIGRKRYCYYYMYRASRGNGLRSARCWAK